MDISMEPSLPRNKLLKRLAIYVAMAGLLLGLAGSSLVVYEIFGGWGVFLSILLFPYTLAYFPFYTLFAHGNWNLLLLNYGSVVVSWLLLWIADKTETRPPFAIDEPPTQPVVTKDNPTLAIILVVLAVIILVITVYARVR